jgi:hypothetical protein
MKVRATTSMGSNARARASATTQQLSSVAPAPMVAVPTAMRSVHGEFMTQMRTRRDLRRCITVRVDDD